MDASESGNAGEVGDEIEGEVSSTCEEAVVRVAGASGPADGIVAGSSRHAATEDAGGLDEEDDDDEDNDVGDAVLLDDEDQVVSLGEDLGAIPGLSVSDLGGDEEIISLEDNVLISTTIGDGGYAVLNWGGEEIVEMSSSEGFDAAEPDVGGEVSQGGGDSNEVAVVVGDDPPNGEDENEDDEEEDEDEEDGDDDEDDDEDDDDDDEMEEVLDQDEEEEEDMARVLSNPHGIPVDVRGSQVQRRLLAGGADSTSGALRAGVAVTTVDTEVEGGDDDEVTTTEEGECAMSSPLSSTSPTSVTTSTALQMPSTSTVTTAVSTNISSPLGVAAVSASVTSPSAGSPVGATSPVAGRGPFSPQSSGISSSGSGNELGNNRAQRQAAVSPQRTADGVSSSRDKRQMSSPPESGIDTTSALAPSAPNAAGQSSGVSSASDVSGNTSDARRAASVSNSSLSGRAPRPGPSSASSSSTYYSSMSSEALAMRQERTSSVPSSPTQVFEVPSSGPSVRAGREALSSSVVSCSTSKLLSSQGALMQLTHESSKSRVSTSDSSSAPLNKPRPATSSEAATKEASPVSQPPNSGPRQSSSTTSLSKQAVATSSSSASSDSLANSAANKPPGAAAAAATAAASSGDDEKSKDKAASTSGNNVGRREVEAQQSGTKLEAKASSVRSGPPAKPTPPTKPGTTPPTQTPGSTNQPQKTTTQGQNKKDSSPQVQLSSSRKEMESPKTPGPQPQKPVTLGQASTPSTSQGPATNQIIDSISTKPLSQTPSPKPSQTLAAENPQTSKKLGNKDIIAKQIAKEPGPGTKTPLVQAGSSQVGQKPTSQAQPLKQSLQPQVSKPSGRSNLPKPPQRDPEQTFLKHSVSQAPANQRQPQKIGQAENNETRSPSELMKPPAPPKPIAKSQTLPSGGGPRGGNPPTTTSESAASPPARAPLRTRQPMSSASSAPPEHKYTPEAPRGTSPSTRPGVRSPPLQRASHREQRASPSTSQRPFSPASPVTTSSTSVGPNANQGIESKSRATEKEIGSESNITAFTDPVKSSTAKTDKEGKGMPEKNESNRSISLKDVSEEPSFTQGKKSPVTVAQRSAPTGMLDQTPSESQRKPVDTPVKNVPLGTSSERAGIQKTISSGTSEQKQAAHGEAQKVSETEPSKPATSGLPVTKPISTLQHVTKSAGSASMIPAPSASSVKSYASDVPAAKQIVRPESTSKSPPTKPQVVSTPASKPTPSDTTKMPDTSSSATKPDAPSVSVMKPISMPVAQTSASKTGATNISGTKPSPPTTQAAKPPAPGTSASKQTVSGSPGVKSAEIGILTVKPSAPATVASKPSATAAPKPSTPDTAAPKPAASSAPGVKPATFGIPTAKVPVSSIPETKPAAPSTLSKPVVPCPSGAKPTVPGTPGAKPVAPATSVAKRGTTDAKPTVTGTPTTKQTVLGTPTAKLAASGTPAKPRASGAPVSKPDTSSTPVTKAAALATKLASTLAKKPAAVGNPVVISGTPSVKPTVPGTAAAKPTVPGTPTAKPMVSGSSAAILAASSSPVSKTTAPGTPATKIPTPDSSEAKPAALDTPAGKLVVTGSPTVKLSVPGTPVTKPSVPGTLSTKSSVPGTPATKPAIPGTPTKPAIFDIPATKPAVPGTPATKPAVPGTPATKPTVSGTPATKPAVSGTPATKPAVSGTPATKPAVPGTPATKPVVPGTPATKPAILDTSATKPAVSATPTGKSNQPPMTAKPAALVTPAVSALQTAKQSAPCTPEEKPATPRGPAIKLEAHPSSTTATGLGATQPGTPIAAERKPVVSMSKPSVPGIPIPQQAASGARTDKSLVSGGPATVGAVAGSTAKESTAGSTTKPTISGHSITNLEAGKPVYKSVVSNLEADVSGNAGHKPVDVGRKPDPSTVVILDCEELTSKPPSPSTQSMKTIPVPTSDPVRKSAIPSSPDTKVATGDTSADKSSSLVCLPVEKNTSGYLDAKQTASDKSSSSTRQKIGGSVSPHVASESRPVPLKSDVAGWSSAVKSAVGGIVSEEKTVASQLPVQDKKPSSKPLSIDSSHALRTTSVDEIKSLSSSSSTIPTNRSKASPRQVNQESIISKKDAGEQVWGTSVAGKSSDFEKGKEQSQKSIAEISKKSTKQDVSTPGVSPQLASSDVSLAQKSGKNLESTSGGPQHASVIKASKKSVIPKSTSGGKEELPESAKKLDESPVSSEKISAKSGGIKTSSTAVKVAAIEKDKSVASVSASQKGIVTKPLADTTPVVKKVVLKSVEESEQQKEGDTSDTECSKASSSASIQRSLGGRLGIVGRPPIGQRPSVSVSLQATEKNSLSSAAAIAKITVAEEHTPVPVSDEEAKKKIVDVAAKIVAPKDSVPPSKESVIEKVKSTSSKIADSEQDTSEISGLVKTESRTHSGPKDISKSSEVCVKADEKTTDAKKLSVTPYKEVKNPAKPSQIVFQKSPATVSAAESSDKPKLAKSEKDKEVDDKAVNLGETRSVRESSEAVAKGLLVIADEGPKHQEVSSSSVSQAGASTSKAPSVKSPLTIKVDDHSLAGPRLSPITLKLVKDSEGKKDEYISLSPKLDSSRETEKLTLKLKRVGSPTVRELESEEKVEKLMLKLKKDPGRSEATVSSTTAAASSSATETAPKTSEDTEPKVGKLMLKLKDTDKGIVARISKGASGDGQKSETEEDPKVEKLTLKLKKDSSEVGQHSPCASSKPDDSPKVEKLTLKLSRVDSPQEVTETEEPRVEKLMLKLKKDSAEMHSPKEKVSLESQLSPKPEKITLRLRKDSGSTEGGEKKMEYATEGDGSERITLTLIKDSSNSVSVKEKDTGESDLVSSKDESKVEKITLKLKKDVEKPLSVGSEKAEPKVEKLTLKLKSGGDDMSGVKDDAKESGEKASLKAKDSEIKVEEQKVEKLTLKLKKEEARDVAESLEVARVLEKCEKTEEVAKEQTVNNPEAGQPGEKDKKESSDKFGPEGEKVGNTKVPGDAVRDMEIAGISSVNVASKKDDILIESSKEAKECVETRRENSKPKEGISLLKAKLLEAKTKDKLIVTNAKVEVSSLTKVDDDLVKDQDSPVVCNISKVDIKRSDEKCKIISPKETSIEVQPSNAKSKASRDIKAKSSVPKDDDISVIEETSTPKSGKSSVKRDEPVQLVTKVKALSSKTEVTFSKIVPLKPKLTREESQLSKLPEISSSKVSDPALQKSELMSPKTKHPVPKPEITLSKITTRASKAEGTLSKIETRASKLEITLTKGKPMGVKSGVASSRLEASLLKSDVSALRTKSSKSEEALQKVKAPLLKPVLSRIEVIPQGKAEVTKNAPKRKKDEMKSGIEESMEKSPFKKKPKPVEEIVNDDDDDDCIILETCSSRVELPSDKMTLRRASEPSSSGGDKSVAAHMSASDAALDSKLTLKLSKSAAWSVKSAPSSSSSYTSVDGGATEGPSRRDSSSSSASAGDAHQGSDVGSPPPTKRLRASSSDASSSASSPLPPPPRAHPHHPHRHREEMLARLPTTEVSVSLKRHEPHSAGATSQQGTAAAAGVSPSKKSKVEEKLTECTVVVQEVSLPHSAKPPRLRSPPPVSITKSPTSSSSPKSPPAHPPQQRAMDGKLREILSKIGGKASALLDCDVSISFASDKGAAGAAAASAASSAGAAGAPGGGAMVAPASGERPDHRRERGDSVSASASGSVGGAGGSAAATQAAQAQGQSEEVEIIMVPGGSGGATVARGRGRPRGRPSLQSQRGGGHHAQVYRGPHPSSSQSSASPQELVVEPDIINIEPVITLDTGEGSPCAGSVASPPPGMAVPRRKSRGRPRKSEMPPRPIPPALAALSPAAAAAAAALTSQLEVKVVPLSLPSMISSVAGAHRGPLPPGVPMPPMHPMRPKRPCRGRERPFVEPKKPRGGGASRGRGARKKDSPGGTPPPLGSGGAMSLITGGGEAEADALAVAAAAAAMRARAAKAAAEAAKAVAEAAVLASAEAALAAAAPPDAATGAPQVSVFAVPSQSSSSSPSAHGPSQPAIPDLLPVKETLSALGASAAGAEMRQSTHPGIQAIVGASSPSTMLLPSHSSVASPGGAASSSSSPVRAAATVGGGGGGGSTPRKPSAAALRKARASAANAARVQAMAAARAAEQLQREKDALASRGLPLGARPSGSVLDVEPTTPGSRFFPVASSSPLTVFGKASSTGDSSDLLKNGGEGGLQSGSTTTTITSPAAPVVLLDEETRMSADISIVNTEGIAEGDSQPPTPTSHSQLPAAASVTPQPVPTVGDTTAMEVEEIPEGEGVRVNSAVGTPAPAQVPVGGEESQGSGVSSATGDSGTPSVRKKVCRMEVCDPDAKEFTVDMLAEYQWPPGRSGEPIMLQEQVAEYLGVKSFKRKYPDLQRRAVEAEEKTYLREKGLVSDNLSDMGLTAINSVEVLDIMFADFPEKYEEYRRHLRERQAKEMSLKQKLIAVTSNAERSRLDYKERATSSAASWNAKFNRARHEQRRACFDLQNLTVHFPASRIKKMTREVPKLGHYPIALIPGQFTDYYKEYTPPELRYFPLNTVLYGPMKPNERQEATAGSEGSQSDSDDSSSSDESSSSSSSEGTQDTEETGSTAGDTENTEGPVGGGPSKDSLGNSLTNDSSQNSMQVNGRASVITGGNSSERPVKDEATAICKICGGDRNRNKESKAEVLIHCGTCTSSSHPSCLDLTLDMVPHIRKYDWQCTDCKTCIQCKDPADEDKMLFCDMCDRGYHIYCVGLRRVPSGRWHCRECAVCGSCGSREPGPGPDAQWQHEYKKGTSGASVDNKGGTPNRVYAQTLCIACSKLWRRGRYCQLCWRCFDTKTDDDSGLITCSVCDKMMHLECCSAVGGVELDRTNFLCEICQEKGHQRASSLKLSMRPVVK